LPLYEYQCDRCGRFEVIQKYSDKRLKACKKCGGPVQKLLSAPAIQFKGTGWYVTDYARKSGGEDSKGKEGKEGKEGKDSKESKETAASSASGSSDASSSKSDAGKSDAGKRDSGKSEALKKAATAGSKKDK
jgi:putative FmdB family regulatory protein